MPRTKSAPKAKAALPAAWQAERAHIRQSPGAPGGAAGGNQQAALAQGGKVGRVLSHAICAADQAARHIKLHNINSPAMMMIIIKQKLSSRKRRQFLQIQFWP